MKSILSETGTVAKRSMTQLILIILVIFFAVECGSMLFSANNLVSIMRQVSTVGIAAFGVSPLMITGNLDFSIGQVYAFVGTMMAFLFSAGIPITLAMLVRLAGGILIFCLTCFISIDFKISRLVVSMAVGIAVSGLSCTTARNKTTYGLPDSIEWLGQGYLFNLIPISTVIFLGLAVIVSFLFRRTYLGRYLSAVGGNDDMVRLSGIHANKIRFAANIIGGLLAGIAGLVSTFRTFSESPFLGGSLSQDIIPVAVPGGISVSGGIGKTPGVVTGTTITGTLSMGLNMMGPNTSPQDIFKGFMLLVAVVLDALSKKRKAGTRK